ncbi:hypothetical protein ES703_81219 [subsurface metagenome]
MADKIAELKAALDGMSADGLRLVEEFARFLVKHCKKSVNTTRA